jgi:hypothetical protein
LSQPNTLDSHPANILGKGLMPDALEAEFIAKGYVFLVALPSGAYAGSRRPIFEVFDDWRRMDTEARKLKLHCQQPVKSDPAAPVQAG